MQKFINEFEVIIENNIIIKVGHSYLPSPKVSPKREELKWYDDSRLLKDSAK